MTDCRAAFAAFLAAIVTSTTVSAATLPDDAPAGIRQLAAMHERPHATLPRPQGADGGPVLQAFAAASQVDATRRDTQLLIHYTAKSASPLLTVQFVIRGPHDQLANAFSEPWRAGRVDTVAAMIPNAFSEPGTWRVTDAYVTDDAYYSVHYDATQLAALGNTSFTVSNRNGGDAVPPRLDRILIQSATVPANSLGIALQVQGTDLAGPSLSGMLAINLAFCLRGDPFTCIYAYSPELRAQSQSHMAAGAYLSAYGVPPGEYILNSASVMDQATNTTYLLSKDFGGTTDFAPYFGSATQSITITP